MYQVAITRNGENVSDFECDAVCLSYLKDGNILSSASAESDVNVCDMAMLGCAAASSALRVVDMSTSNVDGTEKDGNDESFKSFENPVTSDVVNLVYQEN